MKGYTLAAAALLVCAGAQAASEKVELHQVTPQGTGDAIGQVTITETAYGLEFMPDLHGLPPGVHGFHIHANGSCEPATTGGENRGGGSRRRPS